MASYDFYFVFIEGGFRKLNLREVIRYKKFFPREQVWSARLSTGLLGFHRCKPGNRGPKNEAEVILGLGDEGLAGLVSLGFITCPSCKPEIAEWFWEVVADKVKEKYNVSLLEDFTNKSIIPFDVRRLSWEKILPIIKKGPNRLYLPQGLSLDELLDFKARYEKSGVALPPIGYYDHAAPGRFTEYLLK
ncbi:hypothetical protein JW756_05020 [Candidatus Woesearchaeota archaeon]|nr:hypothetical protein [Candidatus Woesearchaeota archaeon]